MLELVNHPGMQLTDEAAASLARVEARHGVVPITSAYRSVGEQQALINRWYLGGLFNRPPYLYKPREPASSGLHVSGRAIDTPWATSHRAIMAEYGFMFNYAYDVVHLEYEREHDQHYNESAVIVETEEDEMTPEERKLLTDMAAKVDGIHKMIDDPKRGLRARLAQNLELTGIVADALVKPGNKIRERLATIINTLKADKPGEDESPK